MAQKIDTSEFVDQFTDGTVRYSQSGIDRVARSTWSFSLAQKDEIYTIRVFQNSILANVNAASVTPLVLAQTKLEAYNGATSVASIPSTSWVNVATGVYTVDLSSLIMGDGAYSVELKAQATFTNPVVTGKTSVITDATASYPSEVILVNWIAASYGVAVGYALDPVDFALNGNISFR